MKWIKTYENFNEYYFYDIQDIFIDFLDQTGYELEVIGDVSYKRQDRFFSTMNISKLTNFDAFVLKFENNGSNIKKESLEELKMAINRFNLLYKLTLKTIQIGTSYWISNTFWGRDLELSEFFERIINLKNFEYFFKKDFYLVFEKL